MVIPKVVEERDHLAQKLLLASVVRISLGQHIRVSLKLRLKIQILVMRLMLRFGLKTRFIFWVVGEQMIIQTLQNIPMISGHTVGHCGKEDVVTQQFNIKT